jgi:long-chain acyl-CoA synthetase
MNIAVYSDLVRDSLLRNRDKDCFHIKRRGEYLTYTYGDVHRILNGVVDALWQNGLREGDSGIVIGANGPEWVVAYHAYFLAGGRTVPVDPSLPIEEIREILRLTQATFIMCSEAFIPVFLDLKKEIPFIKKIIVLESDAPGSLSFNEREPGGEFSSFNEFCASGNAESDAFSRQFSPDDHIITIFTSGTTGKAKGVMLSQRNLTAAPVHGLPRMKVDGSDTMLAVLPLHHVFGAAACIAAALCAGMDVVFVPVMKGPLIVEALREKRVTILPSVPKMIALFYDSIERTVRGKGLMAQGAFSLLLLLSAALGPLLGKEFRRRLFSSVHRNFGGKLRLIVSGAASIEKKYVLGFHRMGFDIVEGYGLTETFGPITICPASPLRHGSVGPVWPDNEMKIFEPDESGLGEVLFRGATVFKGYLNDARRTAEVFDAAGWFHTGDLGRIDGRGYLSLSGRKKDVIVLDSGKNAYPDEIEEYYGKSKLIEEIGVFGVHAGGREIVAALIVPSAEIRSADGPSAADLIRGEVDRMSRHLPSYKKITDFAIVYETLPRTSTKKLKKHELAAIYLTLRDPSGATEPPLKAVSAADGALVTRPEYVLFSEQIVSLQSGRRRGRIPPDQLLELDLGLDSLKRLELLCRLEEAFSITLPESLLTSAQTARDLFSVVLEQLSAKRPEPLSGRETNLRSRIALSAASGMDDAPGEKRYISEAIPRFLYSLTAALWKPAIYGKENLHPSGSLILCANH